VNALASVQYVVSVQPVSGSALGVAQVLGYQVLVKASAWKAWDKCVFVQGGAKLPATGNFEFLRQSKWVVSATAANQGLILPTHLVPNGGNLAIGADVTQALGITLPALRTTPEFEWPGHLPAWHSQVVEPTTNLQQCPTLLNDLHAAGAYFAEESAVGHWVCYFHDTDFGVCGVSASGTHVEPGNCRWNPAVDLRTKLNEWHARTGARVAVIGRIATQFVATDVWDIAASRFFNFDARQTLLAILDVPTPPLLEVGSHQRTLTEWLALSATTSGGITVAPIATTHCHSVGGRLRFSVSSWKPTRKP